MTYNSSITFGGITMRVMSNDLIPVEGTHKQIIGNVVKLKPAPEKGLEWRGAISGMFFDSNRNTDKTSLQDIKNNALKVELSDGEHNGEYYILNLRWQDNSGSSATRWLYQMEIVEDV